MWFCLIEGNGHLDSNHHMNNGQYLKLALATFEGDDIASLRIDYRKQAMQGDTIFPVLYVRGNERVVALYDSNRKPFSVSQFILR